jgi:hypothetical protein
MKIGIYKPFKKIFFYKNNIDDCGWSFEIVNTAKIFAERNHQVYLLSDNDLNTKKTNIKNIFSNVITNVDKIDTYDRIIIWCGSFNLDKYNDNIIDILRQKTKRLDFFLPDRLLVPTDLKKIKLFDNVYLPGTKQIFSKKDHIKQTTEIILYGYQFKKSINTSLKQKKIEFYYGGSERNRLMDYLEYIWRPDHLIHTKSTFLNISNRVSRDICHSTLQLSKYSIILGSEQENTEHFLTSRPYEYYMHDVIAFFDHKYDPDEYYCKHSDFRRVHNYKEMKEKINILNKNKKLYIKIIQQQRKSILKKYINGNHIYNNFK